MRTFKYLIFSIAIIICSSEVFAAKIIGYNTDLRVVKGTNGIPTSNSIIRITLYTDNTLPNITTTSFNGVLYTNGTNAIVGTYSFAKVSTAGYYVNYAANNCDLGEFQNTQVLVFESTVSTTNLTNVNGYYLSFNFCCKTDTLKNLPTVINRNFTGTIELPPLGGASNIYRYNSSPGFVDLPLTRFCVNRPAKVMWTAIDADGDSLVYSLVKPLANDNVKPFTEFQFASGYSINNYIGGYSPLTLNPKTGELNFIPTTLGRFAIAVKVSEYRAGVKIGEIRRELDIRVVDECVTEFPPKIMNSSIQNSKLVDQIDVYNTKEILFQIEDNGLAKDSLFISIVDDTSSSAIPFSTLDTSMYNWNFYNQNGNFIYSSKEFINIDWKSKCIIGLELKPKPYTTINKNYGFKIAVKDNSCYTQMKDTLNVNIKFSRIDSLNLEPKSLTLTKDQIATFKIKSKFSDNVNYKWQVNHELGFEDISVRAKYSGINTDSLAINMLEISDHKTEYRCIVYGLFNSDTSKVVSLTLNDSCKFTIRDTLAITLYDTTNIVIDVHQTRIIEDTLYVPKFTSVGISQAQVLIVFPNPVKDKLMFNSTEDLNSANICIYNTLGQKIAEGNVNYNYVDVSNLVPGMYTFSLEHNNVMYRGKFVK